MINVIILILVDNTGKQYHCARLLRFFYASCKNIHCIQCRGLRKTMKYTLVSSWRKKQGLGARCRHVRYKMWKSHVYEWISSLLRLGILKVRMSQWCSGRENNSTYFLQIIIIKHECSYLLDICIFKILILIVYTFTITRDRADQIWFYMKEIHWNTPTWSLVQ